MSVWREQISNVITVWMWNVRRGNWSCDGLGILLVPRLGWHVRFFRGLRVNAGPAVVKTYHIKNRTPMLFSTNFIYSKSRWKKNSMYTSKISRAQTCFRVEIQALTQRNINRISRKALRAHTHTHTFRHMPKGGSLMEQDILKLPRKTHSPSQQVIPVLSNDSAFMTRKSFTPFLQQKKREI